MNIIIKKPEIERKTVLLGSLKPGEVFHFFGESLEQAVAADDGSRIFMVIGEKKDGRVEIFPLTGNIRVILKKDEDRTVHQLNTRLEVWE